jgi:hypothetical protein
MLEIAQEIVISSTIAMISVFLFVSVCYMFILSMMFAWRLFSKAMKILLKEDN